MQHPSLAALAKIFFRLGFTAFGGPAAHIAMMQREFVEERHWLTQQQFLDMIGVVNLIPGPNSTELAIHVGGELGGRKGMLVAGACFIGPAFSIVLLCAWFYQAYGTLPDVSAVMKGVQPAVLAIIAHALWKLGGKIVAKPAMVALAIVVLVAGLLGVYELALLLGAGVIGAIHAVRSGPTDNATLTRKSSRSGRSGKSRIGMLGLMAGVAFGNFFAAPTVASLFLYFLYVGSVLYGSGYVLVAFLQDDLVGTFGWLTQQQLLDAVAIGQITPGPVFTTATFIGYQLGGVAGSVAATVGIFLPSFLFVLAGRRLLRGLRKRPATAGFLNGINAGALGLIGVALFVLGQGGLRTPGAWGIAVGSLGVLLVTRVNPTWVILIAGAIGWFL